MRSFHISKTSLLSMLLGVVFLSSCKESNHLEEVECEKIVFSSLEQRPLSELQADTTYLLLRSSNPDCPVGVNYLDTNLTGIIRNLMDKL